MITYLLTIDGSTTSTGISIFEYNDGIVTYRYSDTITCEKMKPKRKTETKEQYKQRRLKHLAFRAEYMMSQLLYFIDKYQPAYILMEDTYNDKDPNTYKYLSRIQGAVWGKTTIDYHNQILFAPPTAWRSALNFPVADKNGKRLRRDDYKRIAVDYIDEQLNFIASEDESEAICMGFAFPYLLQKQQESL